MERRRKVNLQEMMLGNCVGQATPTYHARSRVFPLGADGHRSTVDVLGQETGTQPDAITNGF